MPQEKVSPKRKGLFYSTGRGIYKSLAWCERTYILYGAMIAGGGVADYLNDDNWVESAGVWLVAAGLGAATSKSLGYLKERKKNRKKLKEKAEYEAGKAEDEARIEELMIELTLATEEREDMKTSIDDLREEQRRYQAKLIRKERAQANLKTEYREQRLRESAEYEDRLQKGVADGIKRGMKKGMRDAADTFNEKLEEMNVDFRGQIKRQMSRNLREIVKKRDELEKSLKYHAVTITKLTLMVENMKEEGDDYKSDLKKLQRKYDREIPKRDKEIARLNAVIDNFANNLEDFDGDI